jgi:hypothetical protein
MTTDRIWISAVVLFSALVGVNVAQAQRATLRVSSVHARTAPRLSARTSSRIAPVLSQSAVLPRSAFASSGSFQPFGPSPGLGFNFGPANQDWAIKAAIDPATQWQLYEAGRFSRNSGFAGSGFYLLDGGAYYAPSEPAESAPGPEEQAPPAEAETAQATTATGQPASTASVPVEDVGQFVLVLRSGSEIDAVAFTRTNDRIVYVTADGFRRTLRLADLDSDATIRINDERGTPLENPL